MTGIFVHAATTSAISSSVTVSFLSVFCFSHFSLARSSFSRTAACFFFISPAFSYSSLRIARSFFSSRASICAVSFLISSGSVKFARRMRDAASSTRSIALSGRNRSLIYLADSFVAALRASSDMRTL